MLPVATAFVFLLAWQAVTVYAGIPPAILPPPTMMLEQLIGNFPLIMKHTIPTTYETRYQVGVARRRKLQRRTRQQADLAKVAAARE